MPYPIEMKRLMGKWRCRVNNVLMIRPEFGYYHSYNAAAFDLGRRKDLYLGGLDVTLRF